MMVVSVSSRISYPSYGSIAAICLHRTARRTVPAWSMLAPDSNRRVDFATRELYRFARLIGSLKVWSAVMRTNCHGAKVLSKWKRDHDVPLLRNRERIVLETTYVHENLNGNGLIRA